MVSVSISLFVLFLLFLLFFLLLFLPLIFISVSVSLLVFGFQFSVFDFRFLFTVVVSHRLRSFSMTPPHVDSNYHTITSRRVMSAPLLFHGPIMPFMPFHAHCRALPCTLPRPSRSSIESRAADFQEAAALPPDSSSNDPFLDASLKPAADDGRFSYF